MKLTCISGDRLCAWQSPGHAVIMDYAAGAHKKKTKACNTETYETSLNGEGNGPERKAFMKDCLSGTSSKAAADGASQ